MIGYKAFNKNMTCTHGNGSYQYKVGETYTESSLPTARRTGFHFCTTIADVFRFYPQDSIVCEVEALGTIEGDGLAYATNKIKIIRVLRNGDTDNHGNRYFNQAIFKEN